MGRRTAFGMGLLAALLLASSVSAEESPIQLNWVAPVECPQADEVRRRVESFVGGTADGSSPFVLHGTLMRAASGYLLRLVTESGERRGERTLRDGSCTELTSAAVLLIGLAVNPNLDASALDATGRPTLAERDEPRPEAASPSEAATGAPPPTAGPSRRAATVASQTARPVVESSPNPQREAWLSAALIVDSGTLPHLAAGAALNVLGRANWALLSLGASWLPGRSVEAPGTQGVSGRFAWLGADLSGCAGPWDWTLAPGLCAGSALGSLRGASDGVGIRGSRGTLWVTPHVGLRGRYRVRPGFAVDATLDTLISTKTVRFVVENYGSPVFETRPVAFRAEFGLSLRFW